MRLAFAAGGAVVAAAVLAAAPVCACPPETERLLFHSCQGAAAAEVLLLPEEASELAPPPEGESLAVTGGYTGTDTRGEALPNPVGLFVDNGRVVSPNLARMDGILIVGPDGEPAIHHSTRVPLRDGVADLTDPDQRLDFADWASENHLSVLQSHLLIADGRLDVRPQMDAPKAQRRLLFTDRHGWGVYQTTEAVTLFDAGFELRERFRPSMAINLDMGSFDFCLAAEGGVARNCGVLDASQTAKLSNVLRLVRRP